MDGQRHHLCDGGEAGDGAVIGGIFPVTTLVDEHCSSFKKPVVLRIPLIRHSPLEQLLHQLEDGFLDRGTFFDRK